MRKLRGRIKSVGDGINEYVFANLLHACGHTCSRTIRTTMSHEPTVKASTERGLCPECFKRAVSDAKDKEAQTLAKVKRLLEKNGIVVESIEHHNASGAMARVAINFLAVDKEEA